VRKFKIIKYTGESQEIDAARVSIKRGILIFTNQEGEVVRAMTDWEEIEMVEVPGT
jgi:hypothetical protein